MAGDDTRDRGIDDALQHVQPGKRAFLKALVAGTGFAVPTIMSFSMKGLSTYELHAQGGSNGMVAPSDRARKEGFVAVDSAAILDRVAELPIERWQYKGESRQHIGPMAQDFAAAFHVSPDDRHIDLVDANGVALAAIQALAHKVDAQAARITALTDALARLQQQPH